MRLSFQMSKFTCLGCMNLILIGIGLLMVFYATFNAVKRLMKEAQELREPTELYFTQPLEDNLFEWHFTIRGPENTDFDGGLYHGRIILPPEYPMKPPNVILLTPNGRFETNKKICLSISGHHPESWQPSWSIRTALLAIIGFMPTHGAGAIGSLDYPTEERKKLVKRSLDWKCEHCGSVSSILKPVTEASKATKEEAKELATQINFRGEKQPTTDNNKPQTESTTSSTSSTPITTTPPNTPVSTNQTFPTLPTLPGQFPMPAFPFPPFANMPNFPQQQQQGSNFVPRFPYPPQFLPSMFQHMRMPLGNPYIAGNPSCQIPGALQTNSAVTTTVSSSQSSACSGLGESNVTNSPSSTYSGLGESNVTNSLSSSSNSYSGLGESNVTNSASSPSISSSTTYAQSDPVENASMIPPTETVRSEHDSGSSATQSDTTSSAGLRQRLIDNHTTQQFREDNTYFRANAEFQPEPRRSGFRLSTLLIILLLIGIVLLVLRRVYLQRMWRFPF